MDKDFQGGTKESSSENNNNIGVTSDPCKSLSSEGNNYKKENETINPKVNINKSDSVHRHGVRVTASHSTIEHLSDKSGDPKRSGSTGQPRSKSFWDQLPTSSKGPPLMRVNFNGKKGTHGSHGDGLTNVTQGKGLLLSDSLEKGEDQHKKQHILHPNTCLNTAPVAQRVFDSSISFADLVRACGQRRKFSRLETVQLNNSLLSTPQSSTLVSNYFNKYRSYLDHLRKTHGYPKTDSVPAGIPPPISTLSVPVPCVTPVIFEDSAHDPDYVQILEKTTTDSIRNLWSYQLEGGEAERILLQCSHLERRPVPERQIRNNRRPLLCDNNAGESGAQYSETAQRGLGNADIAVKKSGSHTALNLSEDAAHSTLYTDCSQALNSQHNSESGTQNKRTSDFDLNNTSSPTVPDSNQNDSGNSMKNDMASFLPQHNGTAEWGDSNNERKNSCVGYSFRTRNTLESISQKQQRMLHQKQQQEQHQQQQQQQQQQQHQDTIQSDISLPQSQSSQSGNVNSKMLHGGSNSRHKICSRFQGMNLTSSAATSSTSSIVTDQSRISQTNPSSATSVDYGVHVTNTENNAQGSLGLCNGIYPLDNVVSADNNVIPSMSGTMTYSRTLKASYACLDPNSSMLLSTKDGFRENAFGGVDEITLSNDFQQMPNALGESKWMDFQSRQTVLNNENNNLAQSLENPTNGQGRTRMASGFSEPEPPQHWSASLKSGSQRPINKMAKESAAESYMSFCNQKEKNSSAGVIGLGSVSNDQTSISQKNSWGSSFSMPNSSASSRLDVSCDVSNDVPHSQSNDHSRLHQWRLNAPTFESSKPQGREPYTMNTQGFPETSLGQISDSFQNGLDPFGSTGSGFGTKSSWSTCGDISPNKNVLKFLQQRARNSTSGHLPDGIGGQLQHSYQASRLTDQRHKLFNNNNAASLTGNDKSRLQIESAAFSPSEPWSSATCDDMTEYFDSTLQFSKAGIPSSQNNIAGMSLDNGSSRSLPQNTSSINNTSPNSQGILGNFSSPAFRCNDSYNPLQINRPSSSFNGQKDPMTLSNGSFSIGSSLQEHQKKKEQHNSDDHAFMSHDNAGINDCNSLDIGSCDAITTSSPPWYELAPIPDDMEEIRSDKTREQSHLNFPESTSVDRDNQFSSHTSSSEINYHQSYTTPVSASNQNQNTYGITKIENKPRLILGASTVNQRQTDHERDSTVTDNEKNRMLITPVGTQDSDKTQHRKQFPFPCHPKHGCASSSQITANHFQQPQFQIAGMNHQQTTNGVPQQMYCIPNILMPPPQHQQGRHPGVLSYPGMMGNVAPSSPFPQGLMRVPLVDMSRLVYLQSLPFNMTSTNMTPNSNHNNSSSSNPHVNTCNIITINTADNDFSTTGDKGGGRLTKSAGIRGKSTLLRLRPNSTIGDGTFPGLRSTDDSTMLPKSNKLRSNNGNPWDADLEHDFSSSLFSKVTSMQDQSRLHQEFGLVYPETQTTSTNSVTQETNFRSHHGVQWASTPDIHPEMLDMLPVRKQPIEDYNGRQVCWTDMELMMSPASKEQMQVVRKSNKPLGSNKANLISILPKISPDEITDPRGKELGYE